MPGDVAVATQVEPVDEQPVQVKAVGSLVQYAVSVAFEPTVAEPGALSVHVGTATPQVTVTWAVLPAPAAFEPTTE